MNSNSIASLSNIRISKKSTCIVWKEGLEITETSTYYKRFLLRGVLTPGTKRNGFTKLDKRLDENVNFCHLRHTFAELMIVAA